MREEGHKESEVGEASALTQVAPVNIDRVAEGLEGVERDSRREDEIQGAPRIGSDARHRAEGIDEEIEILEKTENPEAVNERDGDEQFATGRAAPFHEAGEPIVDSGAGEEQTCETPIPIGVEIIARDEKEGLLGAVVLHEKNRREGRREKKEELNLGKQHGGSPESKN